MPSPEPLLLDSYYHVYNRGINRENIFFEESNYFHFLKLYTKYIVPVAETFAFCLLGNHFHLLIKTRSEEEINDNDRFVSRKFSNFFNAYAKSINKAYDRTGSLFQHPFGRVLIKNDAQFFLVVAYIHQNPQKHGMIDDFREWKYSSYKIILSGKKTILNRQIVLDWFGGRSEYIKLHSEWVSELQTGEDPKGFSGKNHTPVKNLSTQKSLPDNT